ncbi:hypothetical protein NPIL_446121 [Nephila pilipes]|uniref:Uncharacterized protein n=1 Tax=Nephila pilipes TaxID=299642 RepID=A0A8X6U7R2_NEPPI|nr:hypothetical protein NPIL_446121 [Nephila pilipes]
MRFSVLGRCLIKKNALFYSASVYYKRGFLRQKFVAWVEKGKFIKGVRWRRVVEKVPIDFIAHTIATYKRFTVAKMLGMFEDARYAYDSCRSDDNPDLISSGISTIVA